MKNLNLNDLIVKGHSYIGINVGMSKIEIEEVFGKPLGKCDIVTDDVNYYLVQIRRELLWTLVFDKEDICFEIRLDLEKNENLHFYIEIRDKLKMVNNEMKLDDIIDFLSSFNINWQFDSKRIYLQTVCILLKNGLRMFFSFGDKESNDYGLFSISFLLESHKYFTQQLPPDSASI